jgi:hypothetical protein
LTAGQQEAAAQQEESRQAAAQQEESRKAAAQEEESRRADAQALQTKLDQAEATVAELRQEQSRDTGVGSLKVGTAGPSPFQPMGVQPQLMLRLTGMNAPIEEGIPGYEKVSLDSSPSQASTMGSLSSGSPAAAPGRTTLTGYPGVSASSYSSPTSGRSLEFNQGMKSRGITFDSTRHHKKIYTSAAKASGVRFNAEFHEKELYTSTLKLGGVSFDPDVHRKFVFTYDSFTEARIGNNFLLFDPDVHEVAEKYKLTYQMSYVDKPRIHYHKAFHNLNSKTLYTLEMYENQVVFDNNFFYKELYTQTLKDSNCVYDTRIYRHQIYDPLLWPNVADYRNHVIALYGWCPTQFTRYFNDPKVYDDLYKKTIEEKDHTYGSSLNFVAIDPNHTIDFGGMEDRTFKKAIGNMILSKVEFGLKTYQFSHWHQFVRDCGLDPDGDMTIIQKKMGENGFFENLGMRIFKKAVGMACISELEKNQREHMSYESEVFMSNIGREGVRPRDMYRAERAGHSGNMQPIGVAFNDVECLSYRASLYPLGLTYNAVMNQELRQNSDGSRSLMLNTNELQTKESNGGGRTVKPKGSTKPAAAKGSKRKSSRGS